MNEQLSCSNYSMAGCFKRNSYGVCVNGSGGGRSGPKHRDALSYNIAGGGVLNEATTVFLNTLQLYWTAKYIY